MVSTSRSHCILVWVDSRDRINTVPVLLPDKVLERVLSTFNTTTIAIGIYLMGFGFGWW
jgi:hypothetical protein